MTLETIAPLSDDRLVSQPTVGILIGPLYPRENSIASALIPHPSGYDLY